MEEQTTGEQSVEAGEGERPDELQEQQTGKGYGEDEGERSRLLGDEPTGGPEP
ncbi:MAG: hypothetical protein ICV59_06390 [Thermoleophilia bacterium]|nr:hypothetical protein [Thermoleophilia bacterium]